MVLTNSCKLMLAASALAGAAFLVAPAPSEAASASYCAAYARDVASDRAPRRGLIGGVIAAPFEVTGTLLTGRSSYDYRYRRIYDQAYGRCRASGNAAYLGAGTVVEPAGAPPYAMRNSWDGASCDFQGYSGKHIPRADGC